MTAFRAACVQTCASDDVAENIRETSRLVREAAARGAHFIATPENTTLIAADAGAKLTHSFPEVGDPALPVFGELARDLKVWLLLGSIAIRLDAHKTANRSFLFSPDGRIAARYDKIHLFDVEVAAGESYRESATVAGGSQAVLARTPWGPLGLTICYDLRFPSLYRRLAQAGAFAFTVPSAFTVPTGMAHWHVLLRARAIENGAFVIAPAQGGTHAGGRKTYGHSVIVGPWGEVLAEAPGDSPGMIVAEIDPDRSADARARLPSLTHDRAFGGPG
jgi:predicted amidohydrolase